MLRFTAMFALLLQLVAAAVEEVADERTFKKILSDNPAVVVDFYSQTCGPCIMMAPKFKELAKEYEGRVKFVKVDVQRAYVGVQIRSMPTFHFYLQGKLENQFSGADENGMRMYTQVPPPATCPLPRACSRLPLPLRPGRPGSRCSLRPPLVHARRSNSTARLRPWTSRCRSARSRPSTRSTTRASSIMSTRSTRSTQPTRHALRRAPFALATARAVHMHAFCSLAQRLRPPPLRAAQLVQILKKKYGKAPEYTKKNSRKAAAPAGGGDKPGGEKVVDIRKMDMDDLKAEIYRREMAAEEKEEELRKKKNDRRREKLGLVDKEGNPGSAAKPVKLAVLGGGPAGMTAAIYSARAGLKPVVVAPAIGGQLMGKGVGVENYPGILEANGGDIIKLMKNQAAKFAATFEHEIVMSVDLSVRPFVIKTNSSALTAHSLVISTGADSRWLDAPGEMQYRGGGVSSCATCDGFLWREKAVAVIGGGDTAMEDALVLARTSSHVTVIHRRDSFRASHVLQQAVLSNPKITVMWNTVVKEFKGGDCAQEATCMLSALALESTTDPSNVTELAVDAAFVAIGHIPNTELFKGQLDMTDNGYLVTANASTRCSVDGVFAAGDVADWTYRQAVTSAGSGSQAALDAERWLSETMVGSSEEGDDDDAEQCHPEDYESWTMKKIRGELTSMGVDVKAECKGCMEKSEFIAVLCKHLSGGR